MSLIFLYQITWKTLVDRHCITLQSRDQSRNVARAQMHVGVSEVRMELRTRLELRSVVTLATLPNREHD